MKAIAVTGGIGSGKSLVGNILLGKGYTVVDADDISRRLSEVGELGYTEIVKCFGTEVLKDDGGIDRKKLANIVFGDKKSLERLNSIMHPLVEQELDAFLTAHSNEKIVFVLVPLLFELGWQKRFDKVWLVLADEKTRIERVKKRDNAKEEDIEKRIKNQINHQNFTEFAHNVLYNNSSKEELSAQIAVALKTL